MRLANIKPAVDELHDLVSLFYADQSSVGRFTEQAASDCPEAYRAMLAHHSHMTVTVERRHECQVDVEVLDSRLTDDNHHLRRILLRRSCDRRIVQFGIVRLALATLQPDVRDEILAEQTPLGRVLIQHNVMRRVQLNALWKVECGRDLASIFSVSPGHLTFGRTALIFCEDEPAVELLEIIAPEDTFGAHTK